MPEPRQFLQDGLDGIVRGGGDDEDGFLDRHVADAARLAVLTGGATYEEPQTRIDAERIRAEVPPGLAGAVRIWLVAWLVSELGQSEAP